MALAGILLLAGSALAPLRAQVTVDPGALSALRHEPVRHHPPVRHPPRRATHHPPARRPAPPRRVERPVLRRAPEPRKPEVKAPPPAPLPSVPAAPPNPAVIPPPAIAVPTAPPPPLPPIAVAAGAPGAATPIKGGLRVTFGAGTSTLNPASVAALQRLAAQVKAKPGIPLDLTATAAGSPDDPSTARRLSLERGLAVRAVLLNAGLASSQIYVRAMGRSGPPGPADRVDVVAETALPPSGK